VTERALPGDARRLGFLRQRRQESAKAVVHDEWRRRVMPMRVPQARRAIQQLQEQQGLHDVVGAELQGKTWLVLTLRMERPANPDDVAAKALDAAWPEWRDCLG
jgi:hypothetical protein